jgi:hypothetical protein
MRVAPVVLASLLLLAETLPLEGIDASTSRKAVSLNITVIPPELPVGAATYLALVVSLVDINSLPTLSLSNLTVFLSSSNESVASVPSMVVFPAGNSFLRVDLVTTSKQGAATVTAASEGLASSSVLIRTVMTVSEATSLSLYLAPTRCVNSLVGYDIAYADQLVDSVGNPATTSSDIGVVMVSSNKTILSGSMVVPMAAGTDLALGVLPLNA